MSGGFFRGTTADQDTRFSNKQAKLLKTQKFAPELENLVDMTKVKMDVMRPWIAHRVTELLGFEDEVLINFIYGLLEEKVVNGKEIQITLTGFMEKNTGKFMKELWTHLLSAQKNASGVPQQFLDAKEEETRKAQADRDRITGELKRTKEKEGRELEQERMKKMDGELDNVKAAALEPHSRSHTRVSSTWSADEKNGSRGRTRISSSPHSADLSPPPPRGRRSRSVSKSCSNSRSHSRSRSLSASPKPVQRSVSLERRHHSPLRRSFTPRRVVSPSASPSPPRHGSSHLRRISVSRSRRRSPSPARRRLRSPMRRRSRSPVRRRSRSPIRRRSRSLIRRRSRSPMRHRSRSPLRRRSRSPIKRRSRSPIRRRLRSPFRRRSRSPMQYRSQSPLRRRYRRAPSTPRRTSPSPVRRPRRSPSPGSTSLSPQGRISKSPIRRTPPSPLGRRSLKHQQRSPVQSPRDRHRIVQKNSPVRQPLRKENAERREKSGSLGNPPSISVRSPERDPKGRRSSHHREPALSPSPYNSPSSSGSQAAARRRSPSVERSPVRSKRERGTMHINDSPDSVKEISLPRGQENKKSNSLEKMITHPSRKDENKDPFNDRRDKKRHSPERLASRPSNDIQAQKKKSENDVGRRHHPEYTKESPHIHSDILSSERARNSEKGHKADEMNDSRANDVKGSPRHHESGKLPKSRRVVRNDRSGSLDSGSEESDEPRGGANEKRKHKRSKRKDVTSDEEYSHDSHTEDRKEAKRRRKEEKRLKKEEKRRRREERHRRKEVRRTEKLKLKAGVDASPLSDHEKDHDGYASDVEPNAKRRARVIDNEEASSDQRKLEIELREKALESLRAKKGFGH